MSRVRWLIGCAVLLAAAFVAEAKTEFSRYEVILTRKPFGEPPAEPAPGAAGVPVAVSFAKDIKLVAITDSGLLGLRVGFLDLASKKNYYLKVGDVEDGIEVVAADYRKGAVCLKKGAEQYWIDMRGQASAGSVLPDATPVSPAAVAVPSIFADGLTNVERVKQRRDAVLGRLRQRAEETATNSAALDARSAQVRELQQKVIRARQAKAAAAPVAVPQEEAASPVAEGE